METWNYMATNNGKIVVVIDTSKIAHEMTYHQSPVYSSGSALGITIEDLLSLMSSAVPFHAKPTELDVHIQEILDCMEIEELDSYEAMCQLLYRAIALTKKDLSVASRKFPDHCIYLTSVKGNSAFFELEKD